MRSKPALAAITAVALTVAAAWSAPLAARADGGADRPAAASAMLPETPVAGMRFTVSSTGNEARYRVREQLAGLDFPNDAVGVTPKVSGAIVVDDAGALVPGQSRIVVDVTALKSDKERRDGYVQGRLLETAKFPTVEFVPTAIRGLPSPLPAANGKVGPRQLEMTGDLTVKGVTHPVTWKGTASYENGQVTGSAETAFTFDDFQMDKPRVASVLSVADTIKLEYDFTLAAQPQP